MRYLEIGQESKMQKINQKNSNKISLDNTNSENNNRFQITLESESNINITVEKDSTIILKTSNPSMCACALNRDSYTQVYWKGSDLHTEYPITLSGKEYSTGATPIHTPPTQSQQRSEHPSSFVNGGSVSPLNLSFVEKPCAITARDPNTISNPTTEATTPTNASDKHRPP